MNPGLPPRLLRATLSKITERFAAELVSPATTEPDWSPMEWRVARAVAAIHGVSALLAGRLRWQGPVDWRAFLAAQRAHVAARHRRIEELLGQVDSRMREYSAGVVALKGVELHAMGIYTPGERPMADIDLLVRQAEGEAAARALESLGFRESHANIKHRVYVQTEPDEVRPSMGEHTHSPLKIELHERILEPLPLRVTDVTDAVLPARMAPGLNRYPSSAALMTHLSIHAAGSIVFRALRLIQLHDLGHVCARMRSSDWEEVLRINGPGGSWWSLPPLHLTARYFPGAVPKEVLSELSHECHPTLRWIAARRRLSDVSLSYPWVKAFPGIEWSRSPGAMAQYAVSRIWPSRETRRLRRVMVETEVAASMSEWAKLSQGRRLIRWLTSRQPRFDTLHAVQTALQQPQ
jgi:hypothetical protein